MPDHARPLELDYFEGQLPEDNYAPAELEDAIEAFNAAIERLVLSWRPGKKRLKIT